MTSVHTGRIDGLAAKPAISPCMANLSKAVRVTGDEFLNAAERHGKRAVFAGGGQRLDEGLFPKPATSATIGI